MTNNSVRDLMVPLSEYNTVSEDARLHQAVTAFETDAQGANVHSREVILVVNDDGTPVGELTDLDVLRSLEPGYQTIGDLRSTSLSGMSSDFLKSMLQNFNLWQDPLGALCEKAAKIRVGKIDYRPLPDQYVTEDAALNEALHILVVSQHESVLVKDSKDEQIIGVLHRGDVFEEVRERIKACTLDQ